MLDHHPDKALSPEFYARLARYMGTYEESPPAVRRRYWEWWKHHAGGRAAWFEKDLLGRLEKWRSLAGLDALEVGCGTGSATQALAGAGARILALEPDALSLDVARQRLKDKGLARQACFVRIAFVGQGMESLPVRDASVDLVVLAGVLEHMISEERLACVREAWRVLKPGGAVFVFDTPNRAYPFDHHTTGLWFSWWLPPGLARRYAVFRKRFDPGKDFLRQGGVGLSRRRLDNLFPKAQWKVIQDRGPAETADSFGWLAREIPWIPGPALKPAGWLLAQSVRALTACMKPAGLNPAMLAHAHAVLFEKRPG